MINILFNSYGKFEKYGAGDKSVNAHNCRKSASLSNLFLMHKLIQGGAPAQLADVMVPIFTNYACSYIELPSMLTDLQLYALYFTKEQRQQILDNLKN